MTVERADFDDLVTLITQAPPWEKDRASGVRILLRAIAEGKANAPDQILQRWTWKLAKTTRKTQDRRASAEFPEAKRLLGALANSRGHRHEENVQKLVQVAKALPLDVGAALLASAEGYTPARDSKRSTARASSSARSRRSQARWPTTCPRRRRPPASRGGAQAEEEDRRRAGAAGRRGRPPSERRRPRRIGSRRRSRSAVAGRRKPAGGRAPRTAQPPPNRRRPSSEGPSMLLLLAIGFVAGIVTALSPCVLPVLPIVLAGGATGRRPLRDRRRARRQLHRLHALRGVAARLARAAGGPAPEPRDRAALRRRGVAARARRSPTGSRARSSS